MKKTISIFALIFSLTNLFSQENDSFVFEYGRNLSVYKNPQNNTYFIKKNKRTIWKNLKLAFPYFQSFVQVIDKNNIPFIINEKGRRQKKVHIYLQSCGSVPHYTCEIKEVGTQYIITKDETFRDSDNKELPIKIDSINSVGIQKIYFSNNLREINYTSNSFSFILTEVFPYAVIIEKEQKKGILYKGNLTYYDEIIDTKNWILKVKLNGKLGFYNITDVKYIELGDISHGLARFRLENGKYGYVDKNGKSFLRIERP